MKITEETKVKDLIPEGYELDSKWESPVPFSLGDAGAVSFYIKKKKSKILEDYEEELNKSSDRIISKAFFSILKEDYPKQYYSIILQMIADDICEKGEKRKYYFHISKNKIELLACMYPITSSVGFDTEEHALQAAEIMGDKLKLLI